MIKNTQTFISIKNLEVRQSKIHGAGVFAKEKIEKDSVIGILSGKILKEEDLNSIDENLKKYIFPIEDKIYVAPESFYDIPPIFFMNHSCDPNAGIKGNIVIIALRDINPDEEITIDYATLFFNGTRILCNCNSENCRKSIHGTDILMPEIQKKYKDHISEWIKRKLEIKPETIANSLQFEQTGAWGLVTALDLHDCDPDIIRDRDSIYQYTIELCKKIKVKRFGEPIIVHFGEDERVAGYSLVQLIETSLVSGHFANLTNRVYLDIFSCAYYDTTEVIEFSKNFFKAKDYNCKIYLRH